MTAITPQAARSFVNTIVAEYDNKHHILADWVSDVFDLEIPDGEDKEEQQIIFFENFFPVYSDLPQADQDRIFKKNVSSLSKLFAQSGLLDPPLVYQEQKETAPAVPDQKASQTVSEEAMAEDGVKEADSEAPQEIKYKTQLEKHMVELEKKHIKEVADLDKQRAEERRRVRHGNIKMAKEATIESVMQAHLRKADYQLDPLNAFGLGIATILSYLKRKPAPTPIYTDVRRHFCGDIFAKVWSKTESADRKRIIEQLKPFEAQLNTFSFRYQRVLFKIDRVFIKATQYRIIKVALCAAAGAVTYLALKQLVLIAGQFVNSSIVTGGSSAVLNGLPVVVIQISSGIYNRVAGLFAYVATWKFQSIPVAPLLICRAVPLMSLVFFPVTTISVMTFGFLYERSFGPDAKAQMALSKSLENNPDRDAILEEGMKAYQVWMYLMEQGPEKGLFKEAQAS